MEGRDARIAGFHRAAGLLLYFRPHAGRRRYGGERHRRPAQTHRKCPFGGDSMKRIAAVLFLITLSFAAAAQTNDAQTLYKLGREAFTRGEPEKAVEYFEKLVAVQPNNAQYHYQLGTFYVQAGMRAGMFG